jgi:hypothetical protein
MTTGGTTFMFMAGSTNRRDAAVARTSVKLHIIGIPSAGKTTLATQLSARLGTPYFVLDGLAFVDERWTLRSASERDEMLAEILERPAFITEGGFLDWTRDLFAAADVIIWLDPPLPTLVWRHVLRFRRHPWSLPSLLLFQVRSYVRPEGAGPFNGDPNQTRSGIATALKPWRDKVLRVHRNVSADEIVAYLG